MKQRGSVARRSLGRRSISVVDQAIPCRCSNSSVTWRRIWVRQYHLVGVTGVLVTSRCLCVISTKQGSCLIGSPTMGARQGVRQLAAWVRDNSELFHSDLPAAGQVIMLGLDGFHADRRASPAFLGLPDGTLVGGCAMNSGARAR